MNMNRRQFFRVCSAGLGGSSIALMGFSPTAALAEVRTFKLSRATETRSTCPYCSVACGLLVYSTGDKSKNSKSTIIHVEGDPDNPVNRGTLCPKGAGVLGFINTNQNDVIRFLTVVTVVTIPPIILAGIWGMNFKFMPELSWPYGYPLALGIILSSMLFPFAYCKKRSWI